MSNKTEGKMTEKRGLEMKYKVGDLVVPADGSSYVGEITYISQEEDTVRHKCLKTGTEYEKSYYGFPVRYMSIVEMLEWSKKLSKENTDLHTKLILATEQGQAQDRALNGLQMMTEFATADLTRMETARGERDEARHWLGELLAVIHGDGGHHTEAVGVSQSVSDAHAVWAALVAERDTSRTETNKARTAVVTRVEGTDFDFRWRQDETPVDALIRQRNEAWAELARLTRAGAAINWDPHREDEARWVAVMKQRHARGQEHVCGLADVLRTLEERDEARAEVERLRDIIQEWSYPRLYVQPGVERETLLAQLQENLANKARPSIEAAEVRGAKWALERHDNPFDSKTLDQYAQEICRYAREKR
jgi:hypothetical protein